MHIHIHIHHHNHGDEKLFTEIKSINTNLKKMEQELQALRQEVAENKTVIQSGVTLLQGLSDRLKANAENPAAIRALTAELDANTNEFAAAIAANTPSENQSGTGENGGTGDPGTTPGGTDPNANL